MRTKVMYLLLLCIGVLQGAFAQEKTVSGVVKDENLEPMLGASVIVKGTTKGVSTDENGAYSLQSKRWGCVGVHGCRVQNARPQSNG